MHPERNMTDICILYRDFEEGAILHLVAGIMMQDAYLTEQPEPLRHQLDGAMASLVEMAGDYGFEGNLWHAYLTHLMVNHDNAYSRACEMRDGATGSINIVALHDFRILKKLFDYPLEETARTLGSDYYTVIGAYELSEGQGKAYNTRICSRILALSRELEETDTPEAFMDCVTRFYSEYGVGTFGLHKAFRVERTNGAAGPAGGPHPGMDMMPHAACPPPQDGERQLHENSRPPHPQMNRMMPPPPPVRRRNAGKDGVRILPINNVAHVTLDDLVGYEYAKQQLIENTEAFIAGRPSNNCLLYGDAGTGKSSSIKAIMNRYYDQGLRLIELYKHQFKDLNAVIAQIKNRNYRFIIYLDDLSFEEFETDYKYLKAVIEGDLEQRPDNIRIYATSNRRHLVRETAGDRSDMDEDLHRSDTVQEKTSLSARFGKQIYFGKPTPQEFRTMVKILAQRQGVQMEEKELLIAANQWEIQHGGYSGRAAQQFIDDLKGRGY